MTRNPEPPHDGGWPAPAAWTHGVAKGQADPGPPVQVHRYDERTWILRQSMTLTHEAPFLYLLFGEDRALLLDTGAITDQQECPLREIVDAIVDGWLGAHPDLRASPYPLVVAHTHGHGDHVAGDSQFADRPETTVVGADADAVAAFFGFTDWPTQIVPFDLGGRVLEVTGIPGHHPSSVAIFDPHTGFLLTGDTVYPGRLYAFDMPAFVASLERLVEFADQRPVTHVMGCHIEMSQTTRRDYPMGCRYQPDEPPLQMTVAQLRSIRDAARLAERRPGVHVHNDFIIASGMGARTIPRLLARSWAERIRLRRGR